MGAQSIALGHHTVVAAGGIESMSNVPHLLPGARNGFGFGNQQLLDGILVDGLIDSKYHIHMGECGEETSLKYSISREEQDAYAVMSYERAIAANKVFFVLINRAVNLPRKLFQLKSKIRSPDVLLL